MHTQRGGVLIWIIVVVILLAAAYLALQSDDAAPADSNTDDQMEENAENNESMEDADVMMEESDSEAMMEDEVAEAMEGDLAAGPGTYEDYSADKVANAEGDIVLFFHAKWCPTCRGLDTALNGDLSEIPGDLTILKVDFDTATELRSKYGVQLQHTLVQVDNEGNMITKWSGGGDLSGIVTRLQ